MSGRIRTIKPELLEDAVTAGLSECAFRLFIGMILLADDYGRLRAEPGYLAGQVFWRVQPSKSIPEALDELTVKLVKLYAINGQAYGQINGWDKHQKVSHPGKPRIPAPPEPIERLSEEPPKSSEDLTRVSGLISTLGSSTLGPPTNDPREPAESGGGGDGNRDWGLEPEPECESAVLQVRREPGSVQAYQAAYERGIAAGRGGAPFAMPGGERGELHQAIQTHARDEAGKALRGVELLAWIEHYAAELVHWIARRPPEKRKFWPNPGPKAFLRFLNDTAEAPDDARRNGPALPRDGPEEASLSPGRPRPHPGGGSSLQGNVALPRSLTASVGKGGLR